MTEREAEVFGARLTRIWEPEWVEDTSTPEWRYCFKECLYYAGFEENVFLSVDETDGIYFSLNFHTKDDYLGSMTAPPDGNVKVDEEVEHLAAEWMLFFRRGCWLSGYPIEATAHEKAEWMKGFSREELQAWGLRF